MLTDNTKINSFINEMKVTNNRLFNFIYEANSTNEDIFNIYSVFFELSQIINKYSETRTIFDKDLIRSIRDYFSSSIIYKSSDYQDNGKTIDKLFSSSIEKIVEIKKNSQYVNIKPETFNKFMKCYNVFLEGVMPYVENRIRKNGLIDLNEFISYKFKNKYLGLFEYDIENLVVNLYMGVDLKQKDECFDITLKNDSVNSMDQDMNYHTNHAASFLNDINQLLVVYDKKK